MYGRREELGNPAMVATGKGIYQAIAFIIASATPYMLEQIRKIDLKKALNNYDSAKELYEKLKNWQKEGSSKSTLSGAMNKDISAWEVAKWGALGIGAIYLASRFVKSGAVAKLEREATQNTAAVTIENMNAAMAAREINRLLNAFNVDEDRIFEILRGFRTRQNFNVVATLYQRTYGVTLLSDLRKLNWSGFDRDYDTALQIINTLR
jgi:hypothetical protein